MKRLYVVLMVLLSFQQLSGQALLGEPDFKTGDMVSTTHPKKITYSANGVFSATVDSFDQLGKIVERRQYFSAGSGWRTVDEYDKQGRLVKGNVYQIGNKELYKRFEYTYTTNSATVKEYNIEDSPQPELVGTATATFDKQHLLKQCTEMFYSDKRKYTTQYVYDESGRLKREERNYVDKADGTRKAPTTLYTYNNEGRIIEELYPGDEDELLTFSYTYIYMGNDKKGNWLKREQYETLMNTKRGPRIMERQIEYY